MGDFSAGVPPVRRGRSGFSDGVAGAAILALVMLGVVGLLWAIEIFDYALGGALDRFGIRGQAVDGLPGIVLAPFLHGGFTHLAANSAPLFILGFLAAIRGLGRFLAATVVIVLVSGIGVWLSTSPSTVTIGASGVVFGYFGYLLGRGIFDRRALDIVLAVIVLALYGGLILQVLPNQAGISWQGHLFGLIGGLLAAYLMRQSTTRPELPRY